MTGAGRLGAGRPGMRMDACGVRCTTARNAVLGWDGSLLGESICEPGGNWGSMSGRWRKHGDQDHISWLYRVVSTGADCRGETKGGNDDETEAYIER